VLRRDRSGSVKIQGEPPTEHEFSARWIAREIQSGLASVRITLNTSSGPIAYDLVGFSELDTAGEDGQRKLNFTGWKCRRVSEEF